MLSPVRMEFIYEVVRRGDAKLAASGRTVHAASVRTAGPAGCRSGSVRCLHERSSGQGRSNEDWKSEYRWLLTIPARLPPCRRPRGGFFACCSCLVFLSLLAFSGCSSAPKRPPTGTPEPDRFLFERGTAELDNKDWFTSREYFRQLVDSYPQSPFRGDAKLGIGDTHLGEGTTEGYVMAINEYK